MIEFDAVDGDFQRIRCDLRQYGLEALPDGG